jgi:hypothetical protein
MANKDGLEPGKSVDFETLQRVKRAQREAAKKPKPEPKPDFTEKKEEQPKRGRPAKKTTTEG